MAATDEDFALLEKWRAGDLDAGNDLFERHFDAVHRFFSNKCAPENAADLVQRTFLAAVEARDRFEGRSSVRTFLFSIAHHELARHYRTRRSDWDASISSVAGVEPNGSSVLVKAAEQRALIEALRKLPFDLQVALELFYWENLRGPELAEVLGVPEGTVRSRLRRGLALLRERLAEMDDRPALAATSTTFDGWARDVMLAIAELRDAEP